MRRIRAASAFPTLDLDAAAHADAGRIEITLDLVEKALDRADELDAQDQLARGQGNAGPDRLVAKPLDPMTALIVSD